MTSNDVLNWYDAAGVVHIGTGPDSIYKTPRCGRCKPWLMENYRPIMLSARLGPVEPVTCFFCLVMASRPEEVPHAPR